MAQWNYPQWWIDSLRLAYPRDWQAILTAGNAVPPLTLRVNRRKSTVEAYLAVLAEAGIAARQVGPFAVRLDKPIGVALIPGFEHGVVSVQDAGAQLAAPLLDLQDGMRVLDACAAPGGKTCHILELADVQVTAIDADAKRLPRIAENLERLGLQATLKAQDAQSSAWWDGQQYDHPGRRAVHGVGHRAPSSRYPLAAPGGRVPTCNTFIQNSGQPVADAAPRW